MYRFINRKSFNKQISLRSEAERLMMYWIEEACYIKAIDGWTYGENFNIPMTSKRNFLDASNDFSAINIIKSSYKPDFLIVTNGIFQELYPDVILVDAFANSLCQSMENPYRTNLLEIKGTYSSKQKNPTLTNFMLKQKIIFEKHSIYIQLIFVEKLFKETFIPKKVAYTKTGKRTENKLYEGGKTLLEQSIISTYPSESEIEMATSECQQFAESFIRTKKIEDNRA